MSSNEHCFGASRVFVSLFACRMTAEDASKDGIGFQDWESICHDCRKPMGLSSELVLGG